MRTHIFQHVPFEGPGNIDPWLRTKGYEISATRFYKSAQLPDLKDVDFLIVMGGPMSVNDETGFPWLVAEKQFIRNCIDAGKSVLGICLGSQMIASALGAKVYRNREKEIGWFPIKGIPSPGESVFQFPASVDVFHWHGDTFDLPSGAIHIARSEGCENQAFQVGKKVVGLQFHLETTPGSLQEMVFNGRSELLQAKYIQSEIDILSVEQEKFRKINMLMDEILNWM